MSGTLPVGIDFVAFTGFFITEASLEVIINGVVDQVLFAFAAYNAGPRAISRARNRAEKMGFDRNTWFGHVEVAAAVAISREPVIYVRNIYKYYIAYKLLEAGRLERSKEKSKLM